MLDNQKNYKLLRAISNYLPNIICRKKIENLEETAIKGELINGTLIFADISGFTPMSEKLSYLGKEGAEELTRILNDYFDKMISILLNYGGDLFKFGGDALMAFFPQSTQNPNKDAQYVLRCALVMQKAMHKFKKVKTSQGIFKLEMSIGINSGEILIANVGDPNTHIEYVITGENVNLLAKTESIAKAGQIIITENTYKKLENKKDELHIGAQKDGFYEILGLSTKVYKIQPIDYIKKCPPESLEQLIKTLKPYLLKGLFKKIEIAPERIAVEGEHRRVTVIFINLLDISKSLSQLQKNQVENPEMKIIDILNRYFNIVINIVNKYDGTLARSDLYTKGDKLLILFGTPIAHENDEERSILCALELQEKLKTLNEQISPDYCKLKQTIGLNSGFAFCGDVGSSVRKEYTVMGDEVNLAARVMSVAKENEIFATDNLIRKVKDKFEYIKIAPVKVKGKTEPIQLYNIKGKISKTNELIEGWVSESEELIGRDAEIEIINNCINKTITGEGQIVSIVGEAGIGKSRLARQLVQMWLDRAYTGLIGKCQSYGSSIFYLPWIELIKSYFKLSSEDDINTQYQKIEQNMIQIGDELKNWIPLICDLLSIPIEENELTRSLDAKLRKQRIFDIILELLIARSEKEPLLILFEDLHWIDATSMELLNYIARNIKDQNILLIVIYRPTTEHWELQEKEYHITIELNELSNEGCLALMKSMLNIDEIPEELEKLIIKSQGNPFYVEEAVKSLLEANYIRLINETGKHEIINDLSKAEIPDTINGLIMSRIDRLEEKTRHLLQIASIIGREFEYEVLEEISPYEDLSEHLEELNKLDLLLLDEPEQKSKYIFKHILTQEVAYESLLFARRRELHEQIGNYYEITYKDNLEAYYELLGYHYSHSEELARALNYSVLAADKAKKTYANQEAIKFYDQALDIFEKMKRKGYEMIEE